MLRFSLYGWDTKALVNGEIEVDGIVEGDEKKVKLRSRRRRRNGKLISRRIKIRMREDGGGGGGEYGGKGGGKGRMRRG